MSDSVRIVLTRQSESNAPWLARLRDAGHEVLDLPLLRFVPVAPDPALDPATFDWLVFTSPQGARAFAAAELSPGEARLAALGSGTAAALVEAGVGEALDCGARDGAELAQFFAEQAEAPARVLLPGAKRRLVEPRTGLEAAGFTVAELPLYETRAAARDGLPEAPFTSDDFVFLCSPSVVKVFAAVWDERPRCVAIGNTTAYAAREAGFTPRVAGAPNLESMVQSAGLDPLPEPSITENGS
ncbi:MAG: uroporphyrinogen-III synthase [bacterium]|nr:uroporphyrinogen-III synthase [bacterium]